MIGSIYWTYALIWYKRRNGNEIDEISRKKGLLWLNII